MTDNLALFTDLYELKMAQAYFEEQMNEEAVFSLFVRRLPHRRNYLLACGQDTVLDYLQNLHFDEEDLAYLASLEMFSQGFLDHLRDFRFTGSVYAVPEGTPVFANEPILEIVAPLEQAQLVETFVMNQVHLQTVLASKAQRVVTAADGRPVVDFGARRMHGIDAAVKAARAFYIGGVTATSNVIAAKKFRLPISGTMAHSYIQAHDSEAEAFQAFARIFPKTILLVDTFDTLEGVRSVIDLSRALGEDFQVRAVRLDSGDLLALSREARKLLDRAGLEDLEIMASGGLDENKIAHLISARAPIDGFGVGTSMGISDDAPGLDMVYKLCEYAGMGRLKLSTGKPILPGRKQIFRVSEEDHFVRDVIGKADEKLPGRPLLQRIMHQGERLPEGRVEIESSRSYVKEQVGHLTDRVRAITPADPPYPVEVSDALSRLQREIEEEVSTD
jgi:nicotinate phosphoribosyltransferase